MTEIEWTDTEREAVTYRLVHHYRVGLSNGECLCGHKVPLGHSFTAHQADEALDALAPHVAAREAQAAAKVLGRVADGFRDNAVKMRARGGYAAESSAPRHQMCDEVADVLTNEARRIERGESA